MCAGTLWILEGSDPLELKQSIVGAGTNNSACSKSLINPSSPAVYIFSVVLSFVLIFETESLYIAVGCPEIHCVYQVGLESELSAASAS